MTAYCPKCAEPVERITPSIDPRYPFGHCKTHRRVPALADLIEASRLAELERQRKAAEGVR